MFSKKFSALFVILASGLSVVAVDTSNCNSVGKETVGDKKVLLETFNCPGKAGTDSLGESKIQSGFQNVCGAQCDTSCYTNTQPPYYNTGDCQVITDALYYLSQKNVNGQTFDIPQNQVVTLSYATCQYSFVNNWPSTELQYCRNDFGSVGKYISGACGGGGACVAKDGGWTISAQYTKPIPGN
ncbi:hypothetical protein VNI00_013412 [Paramarasmius palmivorus]|uniref:Secreted protein n=1 Tax=Paramarasmius palmivorus TaxID=297713 RepID=A0AAW0BYZ9_9AGAR